MTNQLIQCEFNGAIYSFREDGWFNATQAAAEYGKRPADWLSLDSTKSYLSVVADILSCQECSLVKSSRSRADRGGGTWLHPRLAVRFAQWLDVRFAVWCDIQIDNLVRGAHPVFDWKRARSEAASSFKVMAAVLQLVRQDQGKPTAAHHFSNEARLVNWALVGEFRGVDRDTLSEADLALLAKLEERNAVLIGCGMDYAERKPLLERYAGQFRPALAVAA